MAMTIEETLELEGQLIERGSRDFKALKDAFELARVAEDHSRTGEIRKTVTDMIRNGRANAESIELYNKTLLFDAPINFDCYLRYVEHNRKQKDLFYLPRRHYLKRFVDGYQELADGKIKLLTISLIKRGGKSQTGINFANWLSGRRPDLSILMEGAGDALVKSFYKGCLEYLDQRGEYSYYDVFPNAKLVETNADLKTINLEKKKRFPTIMCRSIDATQVGLSEATNLLYLDDCVEGREEAKNRNRLDEKWEIISGDIIGRALSCPIVMTGTRYSLYDPIGRMQEYASQMGWAWKAIELPAIDPDTGKAILNITIQNWKKYCLQYSTLKSNGSS